MPLKRGYKLQQRHAVKIDPGNRFSAAPSVQAGRVACGFARSCRRFWRLIGRLFLFLRITRVGLNSAPPAFLTRGSLSSVERINGASPRQPAHQSSQHQQQGNAVVAALRADDVP